MKFGNDYGVFIMHEQLKAKGLLDKHYEIGLYEVWEHCVAKYLHFLNSDYNSERQSEYDCIVDYVDSFKEYKVILTTTTQQVKIVTASSSEEAVNLAVSEDWKEKEDVIDEQINAYRNDFKPN